jgi:hypothetical protein
MKIGRSIHPSYSPDLSLCDFWCFGEAKTALRDRTFVDADIVIEA